MSDALDTATCRECGAPVEITPGRVAPTYCGSTCRSRAHRRRQRPAVAPVAQRPQLTAVDPVLCEEVTVEELERRNAVRASGEEPRIWDGPEKVSEDEYRSRAFMRRRLQEQREAVPELRAVTLNMFLRLLERVEALEARLGRGADV